MKKKALTWAENHFSNVCYLNSNQYSHTSFDCLLGIGNANLPNIENSLFFDSLKATISQNPQWLMGFLGYDLKNELEELSSKQPDYIAFPKGYFFAPEHLVIFNENKLTIESNALRPEEIFYQIDQQQYEHSEHQKIKGKVESRVSKDAYIKNVNKIKQHIIEGDVYELNYCQEFYCHPINFNPLANYLQLSSISPTPFSSFLKFNNKYILCASPERFLRKNGSNIMSQPIKGTIKRGKNVIEDEAFKNALRQNKKEQAENVMIVDLVRNDLAKSAMAGTVKVDELFGIYTFKHWHQMISTVSAKIKRRLHPVDVIKNAFPMGSMTGAPKIRAMQLIDDYELNQRSAYSGAIGYFNPDGDFDFNVVIRSILYNQQTNYLSFSVGSAITDDAFAEQEYEECLLKARAVVSLFEN